MLTQIYYTIIYPHFNYGITCWGASNNYLIKSIQTSQNKIIKIFTFTSLFEHVSPVFIKLKILNIDKIFVFNCLKLMYKYSNNQLPVSISNIFISPNHYYCTRFHQHNLYLHKSATNFGLFSPSNICVSLWSSLPDDIKCCSPSLFRKSIMKILLCVD